jgi:hypothetical protein
MGETMTLDGIPEYPAFRKITLEDIPKVNQPIVATSDAEDRTSVEVSYKPPISMGGS